MDLHDGETIVLEGHPERSILKIWFFTKSIVYLFFASFMTFWAFGFFGGMFSMATENNDFNPVAMGGGFTLVVAIIMLPLSLFYISALQKTFEGLADAEELSEAINNQVRIVRQSNA